MIDAADRSEISCPPDRPPYTTPTRSLRFMRSLCGAEVRGAMTAADRLHRDGGGAVRAFAGRRRGHGRRAAEPVHGADELEDREGDDQEVHERVHEHAV